MSDSCIVLLPPLIVIAFAFLTHRIFLALILGLLSATLIATNFAVIDSVTMAVKYVWNTSEVQNLASWNKFFASDNLMLFLFSFLLGILTVLISKTGGAKAYEKLMIKKVKNKKDVEKASLNLSWFFFLDDYFGSLTVGSVMRPLTDKFKIPRTKLALLVNSIAAPLCLIIPISSWGAVIMINLQKAGISNTAHQNVTINADPFYLYLNFIPFIFYSVIIIASTWFISLKGISIGLMHKHEKIAQTEGNLFGGKKDLIRKINTTKIEDGSMLDFLFPILTLVVSIFVIVFYTGNFYLFGGENSFIQTLKSSRFVLSLFLGGCITFLSSSLFYLIRKKITFKKLLVTIIEGINLIGPSLVVLLLAWSLADILNTQLLTGEYLASLLVGKIGPQFLPLMFFIVTATIAITIGSAWGTIAIMIPIAIQMLITMFNLTPPITINNLPIIYPVLGAILSGCVVGNHISPTSDTMVMSSTSSGSYHMDHVKTMHLYAIPAIFSTSIAFLFAGIFINHSIKLAMLLSLTIGVILNFSILIFLNKIKNGNNK